MAPAAMVLWKATFAFVLITVKAEDFFYPQEDFEDENLEEEVEFPGGDMTHSKLRTIADIPREPFNILIFDSIKMNWREPRNEKERLNEMSDQLERAWHSTVFSDLDETMTNPELHHTSRKIKSGNLHHFISKYVNPTNEPLTGEEDVLLSTKVDELKKSEGLYDNNNIEISYGYITRGKPKRIIDQLLLDLKYMRSTTGERRLIEEIKLNREKPLLQRKANEKLELENKIKNDKIKAEQDEKNRLLKEDRNILRKRLAEKAAAKMKEAEKNRKSN